MEHIPANDMKHAIADPSTPDITARVVELLVTHHVLPPTDDAIRRALRWLLRVQEQDGSWYGRWGATYLYGTWCVVRALCASGMTGGDEPLSCARNWLLLIQQREGSFGESCHSDELGRYDPLDQGLPSQTAWALDALLCLNAAEPTDLEKKRLSNACHRSAKWLVDAFEDKQWCETVPTGSAFPGALHIRYHLYPKVWPLFALTRYRDTYSALSKGGEEKWLSILDS